MPAREKGNQIKHASVPAAHPAPAPSASQRVHGSSGGAVPHCRGHPGMSQGHVTRGTPFLGHIRVSKEAVSKWWASSSDALACSAGGFQRNPNPMLTTFWGSHSLPATKHPPAGCWGHTHSGCTPPPRSHPPPVLRVLGGGAGPAKRIYCSTQGALEAITFPPLDLNGFETSKRIEGAGCQAAAPKG